MSGCRPRLRSPWFGDGMTSGTIEESGAKGRMPTAAFGTGSTRWRFESDPWGAVGSGGMAQLNSDADRVAARCLLFLYAPARAIAPGGAAVHSARGVWRKHHRRPGVFDL